MRQRRHSQKGESLTSEARGLYTVEGFSSLSEYVRFRPKAIHKIQCKQSFFEQVRELVAPLGLKPDVRNEADAALALSPVVAHVAIEPLDLAGVLARGRKKTHDLVIALDHVTDPRNLGAVVRSAAFFGINAIVVPNRRQALLTNAAVNTAQGGFALTDLAPVVNLGRALDELKEAGYWVVGADMQGEAIVDVAGVYEKTVLVLGAEDSGLSQGIRERCDRTVAIHGARDRLESLNVSVAAGILLHAFSPMTMRTK